MLHLLIQQHNTSLENKTQLNHSIFLSQKKRENQNIMAMALRFFTWLVLTVCIVASVDAALTCGTVASSLAPCANYLSKGGMVPAPCCAGVKNLNGMAQTTPDRQQACKCLKAAAQGIDPSLASGLPGKCGVSIPYPISLNTNCDNVK
ncbi:hypothetical protein EXE05_18910 [Acinetobacter pittii]|nr:hypothetical protein EXE05_18910 [Acinetobacter pittii]